MLETGYLEQQGRGNQFQMLRAVAPQPYRFIIRFTPPGNG